MGEKEKLGGKVGDSEDMGDREEVMTTVLSEVKEKRRDTEEAEMRGMQQIMRKKDGKIKIEHQSDK